MDNIAKIERMKNLITILNAASEAYYNGEEIMSNKEFDDLYDELVALEAETGIVLPNSPTQKVGADVVSELPKVKHEFPAKSLDKTKDIDEFVREFIEADAKDEARGIIPHGAVLMWKLDGSTIVSTYEGGKLVRLATRGNGEVGDDITHNAPYIKGLPMTIPYMGKLIVRHEATMTYTEFNRINNTIELEDEKYKNPRNLATATVRMLDSKEMRKREIWANAFNLVYADAMPTSFIARLDMLRQMDFKIVPIEWCRGTDLKQKMNEWGEKVEEYENPVDGLVVAYNNVEYAATLPGTDKFPHHLVGYAFKWQDETAQTVLRDIEWSASRTGLLNPVAVFDPVELEGTTVTRASLHNVSYILDKNLKIGDTITVYKANKIIPQVHENLSATFHERIMPGYIHGIRNCSVCGQDTEVVRSTANGSVTLSCYCLNPNCAAKKIKKLVHFCERDCMNIEGMSEATIEKFVNAGFIAKYADFWHLDRYKDEIIAMEGFGAKSYERMIASAEKARSADFVSFIHSLGIPHVGKGQAKMLYNYYSHNEENGGCDYLTNLFNDIFAGEDFLFIQGIGEVVNDSLIRFLLPHLEYAAMYDDDEIMCLLSELTFEETEQSARNDLLAGKTFVITGSLNHFANREECQSLIESLGGKASGSVSAKTSYLINNDVESTSGKNKKAKELGVPIISEEKFLKMIGR